MGMVLTLIAGLRGRSSLPHLAPAIAATLGIGSEPTWLAPGEACDLILDATCPARVEKTVRALIKGAGVDVVVQPIAGRRKQLLVADMEATIIANEMLDELADLLSLGSQVSELTARAMNGEIDFATALRERVRLLRDFPTTVLDEAARRIRINPGAVELVATMRAHGAMTALVSGGFRIFVNRVRTTLGFDIEIANDLEIEGARLTGTVREPILGREAKLAALTRLAAEHGLAMTETMAVGDGANDLPMLEAAGLGIAFHAKPRVVERARYRVDHADLRALLYVQGYRASEIRGDGR